MMNASHHQKAAASSRNAGVALISALGLLAVASAVMALLFMRTMDNIRHGADDTAIVQTLLIAQGGASLGVALLQGDLRDSLDNLTSIHSDSTGSWSFGDSYYDEEEPTPSSVTSALRPVANGLQATVDSLLCGPVELDGQANLHLTFFFTETACSSEELPAGTRLGEARFIRGERRENGGNQTYALPFVMVSQGELGEHRRRVVTQGEYHFTVGRRSFSRYALFTDEHVSEVGSEVWFTSDTLFDGPVHTNGNFYISGSPWFGGAVSSAGEANGQGAWGYGDGGHPWYGGNDGKTFFNATRLQHGGTRPNMDAGGRRNRPEFDAGVDWRAENIELPTSAVDLETLASTNGIHFDRRLQSLTLSAGTDIEEDLDSGGPATYQYIKAVYEYGRGTRTIRYRFDDEGHLAKWNEDEEIWETVTTDFNGVIYVDGKIDRLEGPGRRNISNPHTAGPAIASFAQLTLVATDDTRITSDLTYEQPPCTGSLDRVNGDIRRAQCENMNARNVLGVFLPEGDLVIGNSRDYSAPDDVRIQASLMTSQGVVKVENYDSQHRGTRGAVELLGGIISQKYGAFGTFSGSTMVSGYSRKFTFDPRLARGLTPPHFPTVSQDGVTDVQTLTFGHREQIYQ